MVKDLKDLMQAILFTYAAACVLFCLVGVPVLVIGGCVNKDKSKIDDDIMLVQPQEPSPIILQDGQTAQLLEDITAKVRIPFQGDQLFEGTVRLQKGSMIVKPRQDHETQELFESPLPPPTREEKLSRFNLVEALEPK